MISMAELHWTAGFLEGEGCFMALHQNRKRDKISASYWMPVVDVAQVNREPLERLKRIYGGQIALIKRTANRQQAGAWRLNGRRAIAFMMTLWSLMSARRRGQIELAIERWKSNAGAAGEIWLSSRARGETSGTSRLSDEKVRAIRASIDSNEKLAAQYSVCAATISNVRHRKTWRHVDQVRAIA